MTTTKLFPLILGLTSVVFSTITNAEAEKTLTPLRVSLMDAAQQYHHLQDEYMRNNPTKKVRIEHYQQKTQAQLPKTLNTQLILQKITANDNQVLHHYYLPNYQSQDKLNNSITRLTRLSALTDTCKQGSLSQHLLQSHIEIIFYIADKNGTPLLEETMRQSDCQEL